MLKINFCFLAKFMLIIMNNKRVFVLFYTLYFPGPMGREERY